MTEYPSPGSKKQPIKEPDQAQAHRCSLNFKGSAGSLKWAVLKRLLFQQRAQLLKHTLEPLTD